MKNLLILFLLVSSLFAFWSCNSKRVVSIAFYNVENLFDTIDDFKTFDEEFLPDTGRFWNTTKYNNKLSQLSIVISTMVNDKAPDILGVCEVENKQVLIDLLATPRLKKVPYEIVHYESIDPRGIDVAAFYNSEKFSLVESGTKRVDLSEFEDVTRDILWMRLKPHFGDDFYILVNHWPSRYGGKSESEPKRLKAAEALLLLCAEIRQKDDKAQIVIMGDFNDEPLDPSLADVLGASTSLDQISNTQLFNATASLKKLGKGSYCYRGDWNMLDQFILADNLQDHKGWDFVENSAQIMDPDWMRQHTEKYEGYPLRTFGGQTYLNGFSDHFPVYIILQHLDK